MNKIISENGFLLQKSLTCWKFFQKTANDLQHVQPVPPPSWKLANSIYGHIDQIWHTVCEVVLERETLAPLTEEIFPAKEFYLVELA